MLIERCTEALGGTDAETNSTSAVNIVDVVDKVSEYFLCCAVFWLLIFFIYCKR